MVIFILERVPTGLRGELSRWLLEPKAGVFVGKVSGLVRDLLWAKICQESRGGSALLIHSAPTEQGFALRLWGEPRRRVEDFEGLFLIRVPR
ncbi:MAG: type I-E CRISPR-associated endoribonuclease Cas2e [Syntrophobacterales bacterium]|nr:type I-E CRISPR-associated endoribonuclease Cas2e [Syntrophobacterales bacterium]